MKLVLILVVGVYWWINPTSACHFADIVVRWTKAISFVNRGFLFLHVMICFNKNRLAMPQTAVTPAATWSQPRPSPAPQLEPPQPLQPKQQQQPTRFVRPRAVRRTQHACWSRWTGRWTPARTSTSLLVGDLLIRLSQGTGGLQIHYTYYKIN